MILDPPFHRMPPVLDGIVGPSRKDLGIFRPARSKGLVIGYYDAIFVGIERIPSNFGVELIVPPLPAPLAGSSWQPVSDSRPIIGSMGRDRLHDGGILLLRPR